MVKSIFLQTTANLALLVISLVATLGIAHWVGVQDFGRLAGLQAIVAILAPFFMMRLDTRVSLCQSDGELTAIFQGAFTCAILLLCLGLLVGGVIAAQRDDAGIMLLAPFAFLVSIQELVNSSLAYLGRLEDVYKYKFIRTLLPQLAGVALAWYWGEYELVFVAMLLANLLAAALMLLTVKSLVGVSFSGLRLLISNKSRGLYWSLLLGFMNALWLNGLTPLLNYFGKYEVAGFLAISQRVIAVPLATVGSVVQVSLLNAKNKLHENLVGFFRVSALLLLVALAFSVLVWFFLYQQSFWHISEKWHMPLGLFLSAVVFHVSSFCVGSLSLLSIRLRDEIYIAVWQVLVLALWFSVIIAYDIDRAIFWMLLLGGLAYWVLWLRWFFLIERNAAKN